MIKFNLKIIKIEPNAPAALALVFSSGSFKSSTNIGTTVLKCSYNLSL